jgi:hypothetical protein
MEAVDMEGLFERYIMLWVVIGLALLAMVFTFVMQVIRPKDMRSQSVLSVVFRRAVSDLPSLIALLLTGIVSPLVLTV